MKKGFSGIIVVIEDNDELVIIDKISFTMLEDGSFWKMLDQLMAEGKNPIVYKGFQVRVSPRYGDIILDQVNTDWIQKVNPDTKTVRHRYVTISKKKRYRTIR